MKQTPGDPSGSEKNGLNLKLVTVGEITGVHGVKGYLKIRSFAEDESLFSPGGKFFLGADNGDGIWYELIKATPHKRGLLALFEGIDCNIAEKMTGRTVAVLRDSLPDLDSDTYYWEDLVGMRVSDVKLGYLGNIDHIIQTGSNDVYVVRKKNTEVLIPALEWVVLEVDLQNREMMVDLPEGLID